MKNTFIHIECIIYEILIVLEESSNKMEKRKVTI